MRRILAAMAVLGVMGMSALAQTGAEEQVRVAEAAQVKAVLAHDEAALVALWSPQLLVNAPNNKLNDVPGALAGMRAGMIRYQEYVQTIEAVKVFGDVVVVAGQEMVKPVAGPEAGKTVQRRFLDVWQHSGEHWLQIARQATVISAT